MGLILEAGVAPLTNSRMQRAPFFNKDTNEIGNIWKLAPSDLLEHYTYEKTGLLGTSLESYNTTTWFAIELKSNVSKFEAHTTLIALKNFLESVPYEERSWLYEEVRGDVFTLSEASVAEYRGLADSLKSRDEGQGQGQAQTVCAVLIALMHPTDLFRATEDTMPGGVLISRGLREIRMEVKVLQSLRELYEDSLQYEHFEHRMFGPQEDELGEEGKVNHRPNSALVIFSHCTCCLLKYWLAQSAVKHFGKTSLSLI